MTMLSLAQACTALNKGQLVVFPTETFYALGCSALDAEAVGKVYTVKKRGFQYPLPVVIGHYDQLEQVASMVPDTARMLMELFWPGALSIVLPAKPTVPDIVTSNLHRIAVRFSSHPAAQQLCVETGKVLIASSANVSGRPPVTMHTDLDKHVLAGAAGIYTCGPLPCGGKPSTIVDVVPTPEGDCVRVLRVGAIAPEALQEKGFKVEYISTE